MTNEQRKQLCEACFTHRVFEGQRTSKGYVFQGEAHDPFKRRVTVDADTGAFLINVKNGLEYPPPSHRDLVDRNILEAGVAMHWSQEIGVMSSSLSTEDLERLVDETEKHNNANPFDSRSCWWKCMYYERLTDPVRRFGPSWYGNYGGDAPPPPSYEELHYD